MARKRIARSTETGLFLEKEEAGLLGGRKHVKVRNRKIDFAQREGKDKLRWEAGCQREESTTSQPERAMSTAANEGRGIFVVDASS